MKLDRIIGKLIFSLGGILLGCCLGTHCGFFLLVVIQHVEQVVDFAERLFSSGVYHLLERHCCFFLGNVQKKCLFHKPNGLQIQLVQVGNQHEDQQVDKSVRILAKL